ncbi:MAG: alpha/beta hydrolase [Parasphingorhabdus sp.]
MPDPIESICPTSHGDIHYFEWGKSGSSLSILLLHATGFHARCWDKVVGFLPDDAHVIAVDQLGHGRSAKPVKLESWAQIAGATNELVAGLELKFDIGVGHSMGAHCLVQSTVIEPESFGKLVLIDPVIMEQEIYQNPPDYSLSENMTQKRRNNWANAEEMFDRFQDRHPYRLWDTDVLRDYCEYGLLPDGEGGFVLACPPDVEGAVYGTSGALDPWPLIEKVKQPVSVLRAPKLNLKEGFDFASSPTPDHLADAFFDGTDVYVPELTHFMPMQDPKRIADLIMKR